LKNIPFGLDFFQSLLSETLEPYGAKRSIKRRNWIAAQASHDVPLCLAAFLSGGGKGRALRGAKAAPIGGGWDRS